MIDFKKLTRNSCAGLAKASGDLADPGTKTDLETNPATCLDDVNEEAQGISEAKKQGKREIGTNSDQSFPVGFEREKDSENEGKPENDVSSMGYEPHFPFSPIFPQNLEIYRKDEKSRVAESSDMPGFDEHGSRVCMYNVKEKRIIRENAREGVEPIDVFDFPAESTLGETIDADGKNQPEPAAEVVPLRRSAAVLGGPLPLGEFLHVPKAEVVPLPLGRRMDPLEEWRDGWASLDPEREPCPGFGTGHWPRIHAAGLAFLDAFGKQAVALNWSTEDLFSVHATVGVARVDCCGALMLTKAEQVVEVLADRIRYSGPGGGLTYYRAYLPSGRTDLCVPVWRYRWKE